MGMLIDFYAGDSKQIADAWHRSDGQVLAVPGLVASHTDFSFHVWPDDLDELALAACALTSRPPMTFAACVRDEVPAGAESGIHELSNEFRDLLAAVPAEQAGQLFDRWMERLPKPPGRRPRTCAHAFRRAIRDGVGRLLFGAVLIPIIAVAWLFDRSFREGRRRNRARLEARATEAASTAPSYTLREGVASLVATCRTAREQNKPVLYAWSL
jgi:hypothetical protein